MAHEIEQNRAFFVGKPAWHELGVVLPESPTIECAASIMYPDSMIELPIEAVAIDANGEKHYQAIESRKAIFRSDGKFIADVGNDYELEQPIETLELFRPYIEAGLVDLETGGSLRGGTRLFALAKIRGSETDVIPGDTVRAYVLAATSFDATMSKCMSNVATRVVCANTLAAAQSETGNLSFRIRHTKNMRDKVADAQETIGNALVAHKSSVDAYRSLARKQMTRTQQVDYVDAIIMPNTPVKERTPQMVAKVNLVVELLDTQRGIEFVPAIRGTAWQAYNAVSEYVTHHAARNQDNRLNNQWFDGATRALNSRALELALAA